MSLDVSNKTNLDLQKTIKKQSMHLTEITASYEELQRQLQTTIDQYGIAQRRIQSMSGELEEMRANYDQALRSKRQVEITLEEVHTRNVELTSININLQNTRGKLEAELATLASDYEEVTRELRMSDERYQKIQVKINFFFHKNKSSVLINNFNYLKLRWSLRAQSQFSLRNKNALSRLKLSRSHWKLKSR